MKESAQARCPIEKRIVEDQRVTCEKDDFHFVQGRMLNPERRVITRQADEIHMLRDLRSLARAVNRIRAIVTGQEEPPLGGEKRFGRFRTFLFQRD